MIPWLDDTAPPAFPPVTSALEEPNGLLAAGGALSPAWLLTAYRRGIFPWYSEHDPILWWSPAPRMVVVPQTIKIQRSLRKVLRSGRFTVRLNTAFSQVIAACAGPRTYAAGTWINADIQAAYIALHHAGWAHSIEAWQNDELVGGLYGIAMGRVFFGESMFHRATDASKVAFAHFARYLSALDYALVDCQMHTDHLASLGGTTLSRADFQHQLQTFITDQAKPDLRWHNAPAPLDYVW